MVVLFRLDTSGHDIHRLGHRFVSCRLSSRLVEGLLGQAISLSLIFTFFPLLSALPRGVTLTTQPHIHEHKNSLSSHLPHPTPNVRMIFHAYNFMDNEWQDEFMKDVGAREASTSHPSTYFENGLSTPVTATAPNFSLAGIPGFY